MDDETAEMILDACIKGIAVSVLEIAYGSRENAQNAIGMKFVNDKSMNLKIIINELAAEVIALIEHKAKGVH